MPSGRRTRGAQPAPAPHPEPADDALDKEGATLWEGGLGGCGYGVMLITSYPSHFPRICASETAPLILSPFTARVVNCSNHLLRLTQSCLQVECGLSRRAEQRAEPAQAGRGCRRPGGPKERHLRYRGARCVCTGLNPGPGCAHLPPARSEAQRAASERGVLAADRPPWSVLTIGTPKSPRESMCGCARAGE